jgi:hypothetical protein
VLVCLAESLAFSDIIRQYITSRQFDERVIDNMLKERSLAIKPGAQVFMSLPFTRRKDSYWHQGMPALYCSAYPTRLWKAYDLGLDNMTYCACMRAQSQSQAQGLYEWTKELLEQQPASKLYPIYLDQHNHPQAVASIKLVRKDGAVQEIETAYASSNAPGSGLTLVAREPQVRSKRF